MKLSEFTALKAANDNPVVDRAIRDLFDVKPAVAR